MLRSMRTTQEVRANGRRTSNRGEERPYRIRAKRGKRLLPNAYCDRSSCVQRSWKVNRLTQYRAL